MLVDQSGKPFKPLVSFETLDWIRKDSMRNFEANAAMMRVMALRDACGLSLNVGGAKVGESITIKKPARLK